MSGGGETRQEQERECEGTGFVRRADNFLTFKKLDSHKHDIGPILKESLELEAQALALYHELLEVVACSSIALEKFARQMIQLEEPLFGIKLRIGLENGDPRRRASCDGEVLQLCGCFVWRVEHQDAWQGVEQRPGQRRRTVRLSLSTTTTSNGVAMSCAASADAISTSSVRVFSALALKTETTMTAGSTLCGVFHQIVSSVPMARGGAAVRRTV